MTSRLPWTIPGGQQVQFTPYQIAGRGGGDAFVSGNGTLRSEGFQTGVSGWRVLGNGNVEFNDGNFRGDISGATGTFTGALTVGSGNTVFKVASDGDMWIGHADQGSAPFQVDNLGNLTATSGDFSGTLDGEISAATMIGNTVVTNDSANSLQSGNFSAGVSGWRIRGNGNAEFNDVTVRGSIVTNGGTGAHVDIGEYDLAEIAYYHGGAVSEQLPAYTTAQYSVSPAYGLFVLVGPDMATSGTWAAPPAIALQHYNDGSNATVFVSDTRYFWVNEGQIIADDGTPSAPTYAFHSDLDVGLFLDATGRAGIAGSLNIDDSGSAASPALSFDTDTNTGIYRISENVLGFSMTGAERMRMGGSDGDFQISVDPEDISVTDYDSWDDYGSPWDFHASKDVHGYVHLEGLYRNNNGAIANASTYPNIILLPSGSRPRDDMVFGQFNSSGNVDRVNVLASGAVQLGTGASVASSGWITMAGISFYAGW